MLNEIKKSIHNPCPYGNDECPKCKPTMNQPNNKIREVERVAMNIVYQLDDDSGASVEFRQANNDKRIDFVMKLIDELLKSQELNYKINCSKHGHITPKPVCPKCYNKTLAELDVLIYDKSKRK